VSMALCKLITQILVGIAAGACAIRVAEAQTRPITEYLFTKELLILARL
jgi:hypothetical protein